MRCADTRVRIEFRDWKQVLRSREGRRRGLEAKKKKRKKEGTIRGSFSAVPFLGLLSKAFRRGAKIGERF